MHGRMYDNRWVKWKYIYQAELAQLCQIVEGNPAGQTYWFDLCGNSKTIYMVAFCRLDVQNSKIFHPCFLKLILLSVLGSGSQEGTWVGGLPVTPISGGCIMQDRSAWREYSLWNRWGGHGSTGRQYWVIGPFTCRMHLSSWLAERANCPHYGGQK